MSACRSASAGVRSSYHDRAAVAADREDVEVERIRGRVIVRDDVVLELQASVEDAVAQCKNLVRDAGLIGHDLSPMLSFLTEQTQDDEAARSPFPARSVALHAVLVLLRVKPSARSQQLARVAGNL
jgi:hypothetical protein